MKDIYTASASAFEVLEARRQDTEIRDRVAQYLGNVLPAACFENEQPVAMLARYVPRATDEDRIFADVAASAGFEPYWASYLSDRFTTRNPEKVETVRPPIRWRKGQKTRAWIVEPEQRVGGVGELQTVFGYDSCDYQRGMRDLVLRNEGMGNVVGNTFDMGAWYKLQAKRFGYGGGALASYYYPAMMALATTFGALYEDFDGGPNASNGDLTSFRNRVVYPAIQKVESDIGLSPVIVRLPYRTGMNETDLSFLGVDEAEQCKRLGSLSVATKTKGDV